nr:uncharacterized protein LOC116769697 [Danaus plexippus plexippus]
MRPRSMARYLSGTVKEILGTAQSVGCTVEGRPPHDLIVDINEAIEACPFFVNAVKFFILTPPSRGDGGSYLGFTGQKGPCYPLKHQRSLSSPPGGWTRESLKACNPATIRRQAANGHLPEASLHVTRSVLPPGGLANRERVNPLPLPPKPTRSVSNYQPPSASVQRQTERRPAVKRPGPPKRPEFPFAAFSGDPPPHLVTDCTGYSVGDGVVTSRRQTRQRRTAASSKG